LTSLAGTLSAILAGPLLAVVWVVGMRSTTFPACRCTCLRDARHRSLRCAAAILPALRAARRDPLAALRYE
jgi:hypothetical protein